MKICNIITLDNVDSTNSYVKRNKITAETCVRALCQSAGRGRLGRSFLSPAGGLYFSVVLNCSQKQLATIAAAVAVADCIENCLVKWPNDILINGKKACGILCEGNSVNDDVIIGVGINVASSPIEGSCAVGGDAEVLFAKVLESMERVYTLLEYDSEAVIKSYEKRLATKNVTVRVNAGGKELVGMALGIDNEARLLVRIEDNVVAVNSGEATIIKE